MSIDSCKKIHLPILQKKNTVGDYEGRKYKRNPTLELE